MDNIKFLDSIESNLELGINYRPQYGNNWLVDIYPINIPFLSRNAIEKENKYYFPSINITSSAIHLDDNMLLKRCNWIDNVGVIFSSSFTISKGLLEKLLEESKIQFSYRTDQDDTVYGNNIVNHIISELLYSYGERYPKYFNRFICPRKPIHILSVDLSIERYISIEHSIGIGYDKNYCLPRFLTWWNHLCKLSRLIANKKWGWPIEF